jgi:hypothetical protein
MNLYFSIQSIYVYIFDCSIHNTVSFYLLIDENVLEKIRLLDFHILDMDDQMFLVMLDLILHLIQFVSTHLLHELFYLHKYMDYRQLLDDHSYDTIILLSLIYKGNHLRNIKYIRRKVIFLFLYLLLDTTYYY